MPALLALAVFAIGLSLYGVTIDGLPGGSQPAVSEATMDLTVETLSDGPVVIPQRIDRVPEQLPDVTGVIVRVEGRTWRSGSINASDDSRRRQVLVRTPRGEVPGTLRVVT